MTPSNSLSFGYDNVDRLTRMDGGGGLFARQDFLHDANGNRTAVERRTNTGDLTPAESDAYATTSGTNRLASVTQPSGTRGFTHDARGNLVGETRPGGGTVTLGYDGHARLASYAATGAPSQAMGYNGFDERVRMETTLPGGGATDTRHFLYDQHHRLVGEYSATTSDLRAEYIWLLPEVGGPSPFGGDDGLGGYMPLAVVVPAGGGTAIHWVQGNHLGTPVAVTDASGALVSPSGYSMAGFPGQVRQHAELYYNYYRDYDVSLGRYVQADPIGLDGDVNPYTYVGGNPVNFVDPDGLKKVDLFGPGDGGFHDGVRRERDISGVCQVYGHMSPRGIEVWRNGRKVFLRDPADINRELMRRGCKPKQPVYFLGCRAGEGDDPIAKQYADRYRVRTVGSTQYTWWGSGGFGGIVWQDQWRWERLGQSRRVEAIWTMTRNYHFLLMALLLAASMGCTDRGPQEQRIGAAEEAQLAVQAQAGDAEAAKQLDQIQKMRSAVPQGEAEVTPDIRDAWQWPAGEVAALIKRAKSGDMEAADRLHQYYSVHEDKAQIAYWEDWLFKRGDPKAIRMRVHRLYSASEKRLSDDPRKLVELKEAERLERSVTADRADNPFLNKIRSEVAAIEGSR